MFWDSSGSAPVSPCPASWHLVQGGPLGVAFHPGSRLALGLRHPPGHLGHQPHSNLRCTAGHPSAQVIGWGHRGSPHTSYWAQAPARFLTHPEALGSSSRSEDQPSLAVALPADGLHRPAGARRPEGSFKNPLVD